MIKKLMIAVVLVLVVVAGLSSMGCEGSAAPNVTHAGPNAIEIVVRTEPPGATVVVDGAPFGPSPATMKLNPGPHRLRASMSGYYPAPEAKIQVGASEPREHVLTLVASH